MARPHGWLMPGTGRSSPCCTRRHPPSCFRAWGAAGLLPPAVGMWLAVDPPSPCWEWGRCSPGPEHASHLGAQPQLLPSPSREAATTVPAQAPPVLRGPLGQPVLRSPRAGGAAESRRSPRAGGRARLQCCGLRRSLGGRRTRFMEMPLVTGPSPQASGNDAI